jgi:hypothetical protein
MPSNLSNTKVVPAVFLLVRPSFNFSPKEVLEFCNECVLNEDENSECEIPETFYDRLKP